MEMTRQQHRQETRNMVKDKAAPTDVILIKETVASLVTRYNGMLEQMKQIAYWIDINNEVMRKLGATGEVFQAAKKEVDDRLKEMQQIHSGQQKESKTIKDLAETSETEK